MGMGHGEEFNPCIRVQIRVVPSVHPRSNPCGAIRASEFKSVWCHPCIRVQIRVVPSVHPSSKSVWCVWRIAVVAVNVGWVEGRNPTFSRIVLGFASRWIVNCDIKVNSPDLI